MEPSLLLALLKPETPSPYQVKRPRPTRPQSKYNGMDEKQKKQVQESLYQALYSIIEYQHMPQNRDLNAAIGKALARAIEGDTTPLIEDTQIKVNHLRDILKQVVTEIIDEIKP